MEEDTEDQSLGDTGDGGPNNEESEDNEGLKAESEVQDDVYALLDDDDLRADGE